MRDTDRVDSIREALREQKLDAVICALPVNVLLLSGYWPVIGLSLAVATKDGRVVVLAPEDEEKLARCGGADEVRTFSPASLARTISAIEAVAAPLQSVVQAEGLQRSAIGFEAGPAYEPASYAAVHLYGAAIREFFNQAIPSATLKPADEMLGRLRTVKTPKEIDRLRTSCRIARRAFIQGASELRAGLREAAAAHRFRADLDGDGESVERADGFVYCMSGPNAAQAYAAYQRSRPRAIQPGETILVHCNSYADGYWTDITRTYCISDPVPLLRQWYAAVREARAAALQVIRPGVRAALVDRAAREVLDGLGFGPLFRHPTGHGVGFAAIDHHARPPPRLPRCSWRGDGVQRGTGFVPGELGRPPPVRHGGCDRSRCRAFNTLPNRT